jgi:lipid II:glycine glycyltransferase (peptidoglycan interpeptide bridge formation enzyme)
MNLSFIQQTKTWAEFRKQAKGEKFWEIQDYGFIQKMPLPLGKCWLYCNRGPKLDYVKESDLREFLSDVQQIANREKAVFLRIESPFIRNSKQAELYRGISRNMGFKIAHASHQPTCTLVIDLSQPLEKILEQMKQKGRYNIKLAEKKGVKIKESKNVGDFYKILNETTKRDKFLGHKKEFYQAMIDILSEKDMATLYMAEYEGEKIAGILVTYYNGTATYYYGASSNRCRNVMAPYLLQWHAIQEAKNKGMKYYDFLGISPPDAKNHPWKGVTAFKMKFGGEVIEYIRAREYIFKPFWYWLMILIKKIKR